MIQKPGWKSTIPLKAKEETNNFPLEIKQKIANKTRFRKQWQRTRNAVDKNILNVRSA